MTPRRLPVALRREPSATKVIVIDDDFQVVMMVKMITWWVVTMIPS